MCKVAYPKFATVYNPNSALLALLSHPPHSHLPPSQMHLLTWFFLLWPLAIIYYHMGILNSFLLHCPIPSVRLFLYIFHKISVDPDNIFTDDLILGFSMLFPLVQGMF